jgi:hypothetical protein
MDKLIGCALVDVSGILSVQVQDARSVVRFGKNPMYCYAGGCDKMSHTSDWYEGLDDIIQK